ncbi:unnamed protein product, partial [Brenthis ino]
MAEHQSKLSATQSAIAGGISGAFTRAIAQPLDVLKVRFQLQLEPIKTGSKYSSILQAVRSIIKEEGITTLWSGHIPAQLLSISYGIIQFATYEKLTQICCQTDQQLYKTHKHWINFSNGAIAATAATIFSFPLDTVRTRLIAEQKTNKVYKGFSNAFIMISKNEGPRALYKGIVPTIAQVAPHAEEGFLALYKGFAPSIFKAVFVSALHFAVYDEIKHHILKLSV